MQRWVFFSLKEPSFGELREKASVVAGDVGEASDEEPIQVGPGGAWMVGDERAGDIFTREVQRRGDCRWDDPWPIS